VYVRADKDFPTNGESCNYWVARIDERTNTFASQPVQLTHNRGFCMVDTSATADSKRLVFTKRSEDEGVYVADVEAGGTRITPPRHLSMIQGVEFPNGWTPDSREVLYTSNRDEGWGIYRQPVSGGSAQPVLVEKTAGRRADFGFPRLSPDGGWLLIERPSPGSTLGIHNDLLRVPVSGGPEQLIASDIWGIPNCAAPPIPICAYSKKENNQIIFIGFDPRFKQKRELGRFTFIDPKAFYGGMLSPDATQIVISRPAAGDIYLLNLQTKALRKIIVKNWTNFVSMDWTADGKGLFVSALQPAGVLLHIDLHGNAQVLWQPGGEQPVWALPSPDGKHVAMPADSVNLNVWMMENF
jgi:Tol biopolymer transport system component